MPSMPEKPVEMIGTVPLSSLQPSATNPRRVYAGIEELAASIAEHGLLALPLVRPRGVEGGPAPRFVKGKWQDLGCWEVVLGERRRRALVLLGNDNPVRVLVRELSDEEVVAIQLADQPGDPPVVQDLAGLHASDCCVRILEERGGGPLNALTLAREALRRGYQARTQGDPDDVLMTTAKSFWARLGRDERVEQVRPQVFALKRPAKKARPVKAPKVEAAARQDKAKPLSPPAKEAMAGMVVTRETWLADLLSGPMAQADAEALDTACLLTVAELLERTAKLSKRYGVPTPYDALRTVKGLSASAVYAIGDALVEAGVK